MRILQSVKGPDIGHRANTWAAVSIRGHGLIMTGKVQCKKVETQLLWCCSFSMCFQCECIWCQQKTTLRFSNLQQLLYCYWNDDLFFLYWNSINLYLLIKELFILFFLPAWWFIHIKILNHKYVNAPTVGKGQILQSIIFQFLIKISAHT